MGSNFGNTLKHGIKTNQMPGRTKAGLDPACLGAGRAPPLRRPEHQGLLVSSVREALRGDQHGLGGPSGTDRAHGS